MELIAELPIEDRRSRSLGPASHYLLPLPLDPKIYSLL